MSRWFGQDDQDDPARPAHAAGSTAVPGGREGHRDDATSSGGGEHRLDDTGGGLSAGAGQRDGDPARASDADVTLSEERMTVGTETVEAGRVRARKQIDVEQVSQVVPRGVEHADLERAAASEGDSGQVETLPDGSISIPVFEEQIVIEKRLVVRERVILRKHTVYEEHQVQAELRRERLEIETDGDARVTEAQPGTAAAGTAGAAGTGPLR